MTTFSQPPIPPLCDHSANQTHAKIVENQTFRPHLVISHAQIQETTFEPLISPWPFRLSLSPSPSRSSSHLQIQLHPPHPGFLLSASCAATLPSLSRSRCSMRRHSCTLTFLASTSRPPDADAYRRTSPMALTWSSLLAARSSPWSTPTSSPTPLPQPRAPRRPPPHPRRDLARRGINQHGSRSVPRSHGRRRPR